MQSTDEDVNSFIARWPAAGGGSERARTQAEICARALPAAEGRPPFLGMVDVSHVIEL